MFGGVILGLGLGFSVLAGPREIALRHERLVLPGPPAAVIPADVDGDGRTDLAVVVAYTGWGEVATTKVEELVQVMEVVAALADRRELHVFLAKESGGFAPAGPPLELPASVLALEAGPKGLPPLALTDDGIARVLLGAPDISGAVLSLAPLRADVPFLAGTGTFLPNLEMLADVDGDGQMDVLVPARDGLSIHRGGVGRLEEAAPIVVPLPGADRTSGAVASRFQPRVAVRDLDGDKRMDLVVGARRDADGLQVLSQQGGGISFGAPRALKPPKDEEIVFAGDLDGDGKSEVVTEVERKEKKESINPKKHKTLYRVRRVEADLSIGGKALQEFEAAGFGIGAGWPDPSGSPFRDLDGDGKHELVTVIADVSMFQIARAVTTKKISIGLEFQVYVQDAKGSFRAVKGLDLSETLKLDLDDLDLGRFAQFAGDFDGDGRIDFVHLGRGTAVTIHRGVAGCRYAKKPDLAITLKEEPQDLALVRVEDLDGDGKSDLAFTRALPAEEGGVTAQVQVDLYLSGDRTGASGSAR